MFENSEMLEIVRLDIISATFVKKALSKKQSSCQESATRQISDHCQLYLGNQ